jgi:glucose/mannose-6-phosphate isomerase
VDKGGVYEAYRDWPALAREGFEVKFDLPEGGFSRAVVLGMGGSAAGGDIIAGWIKPLNGVELSVCKGSLPFHDMKGILAIACSASGETAETIEMMKTASKRGATIVSISSGGRLGDESSELGATHIMMPEIVAPRYMLPFIVFSCLAVLNRAMGLGCDQEANEATSELGRMLKAVDIGTQETRNPAKKLARRMIGGTPVVLSDEVAKGVGIRFKNAMNENAKRHAFFDVMPDMFHNEVQAWEDSAKGFIPTFLRHDWEDPVMSRKTDAFVRMLRRNGNRSIEVRGEGASRLSQLITMAFLLDMVSYYTAIQLGRDPLPTKTLDSLKRI